MILCLPPLDSNQSLRGYYLYSAHLACAVLSKYIYITLRTSKPLSRLVKASCNPLLADEILSTTIPIKVRCASEIAACSRRPISASGHAPDSPGLFLWLSLGAEYSGLRVAEGLPSGLGRLGEILRDYTSGSSALGGGETRGGVSLSIIFGRRSPEDELCREGLRSGLQDICLGYCPRR